MPNVARRWDVSLFTFELIDGKGGANDLITVLKQERELSLEFNRAAGRRLAVL